MYVVSFVLLARGEQGSTPPSPLWKRVMMFIINTMVCRDCGLCGDVRVCFVVVNVWRGAGLRTAVGLFFVVSVAFGRGLLLSWRGASLRTAGWHMLGQGTNLARIGSRTWRFSSSGCSSL